jgi:hypothetical protein
LLDYSKQNSTQYGVDNENFGNCASISGQHCRFISSRQRSSEDPAKASICSQGEAELTPDRGHFSANHGFFTLPIRKWQPDNIANALADKSATSTYDDLLEFPSDDVSGYLVQ